uniref:Uncharacterized protein LOC104222478 n=1 Tax=Nicotiana sylvestris TaxID=4096 RepID=A0A1U7W483_NICSY
DSYDRGHSQRPFQSALQVSHGTPGGGGPQQYYSGQQTFSAPPAPISAPPLQSFRGGHTGQQGHQSQQPRACYGCGNPSHIVRFCPRASSSSQEQGLHPTIQAVGDPQAAQPARGGSRDHRGGGRDRRGGARTAKGRGQPAADRPRDTFQGGGGQSRCYALLARPEAESSDAVIT